LLQQGELCIFYILVSLGLEKESFGFPVHQEVGVLKQWIVCILYYDWFGFVAVPFLSETVHITFFFVFLSFFFSGGGGRMLRGEFGPMLYYYFVYP
jgi:hypothetical protein